MSIQYSRIRLGAPDYLVLDAATATPIDLGATTGGVTFAYNATYLPIEIDQTILPASAFKTKEEVMLSMSLVQEQVSTIQVAYSLQASYASTVLASTTASPSGGAVTQAGTAGVASYSYTIVPLGVSGGNGTLGGVAVPADGIPSAVATTTTGPTTLSTVNYNVINWTQTGSASNGYRIVRTVGGASQGSIGTVPYGVTGFIDTGIAATAYVASSIQATNSTVDTVTFGGDLSVPTHTFDWAVPKNDGTQNHWVGHLRKVFSGKQVTTNYARDKVTEISKVELMALADTSLPVGQQAGSLYEER